MERNKKFWLLVGPTVFGTGMAISSPVIQVHFMQLITPGVLALANMLAVGIAAVTNMTMTKDKFIEWYDSHFLVIVGIFVGMCYA